MCCSLWGVRLCLGVHTALRLRLSAKYVGAIAADVFSQADRDGVAGAAADILRSG